MNRRGFLVAMLAACAAPAIVRADSLMRIVPRDLVIETYRGPLTSAEITRECLRILNNQLQFAPYVNRDWDGEYKPERTILIRKPRRFALEAA